MTTQPANFYVRPPTTNDAQQTIDLMTACDIADYGEADSSLDDLVYEWRLINLETDAWLVFNPQHQLAGYAAIYENQADFSFDLYTHPQAGNDEISRYLVTQSQIRARAKLASRNPADWAVTTIISQTNQANRQVLTGAGFTPLKYYFRMEIAIDTPPPAVNWPAGTTLRPIKPGEDDRMVYDFIQAAFDRPGRVPPTFEKWRDYMMRADHFDPTLWFLLLDGSNLIGASLCYDYQDYGWVRQLGVDSALRRQGLGAKLLQYSFGVFFARGRHTVALAVDSERPNAQALYGNVGMTCARRYDEYHKPLAAV